MNLFSWLFAGSRLFFACTGDLTHSYVNGPYRQDSTTEKVTASLMLDEAKQALAFRPSGYMAPAIFNKEPDDVAHKRTCQEINERWDKRLAESNMMSLRIHNCGDVWSDDTSLYFNLEYRSDANFGERTIVDTYKGRLDRVTGRLEVNSWVSNDENRKNTSWGRAVWVLICKKVDKLVDAK